MSRSTSSDRLGRWDSDDDSDRPHKKLKYSETRTETSLMEDDADSVTKTNLSIISNPESDCWVVTRCLARRKYGSVYLALRTTNRDEENDLPYEMVIKSNEISQSSYLSNEVKFLVWLKSPYIVSCYGHEMSEDKNEKKMYVNSILEYCPGQSLAKHVKRSNNGGLPVDEVKRYAGDILFGLKRIHEEEIIHCDINTKNILLTPENNGRSGRFRAKISALGNAMEKGWIEDGGSWNYRSGTTRFMSPELIRDKVLDYGADVWAFGCTVLEMLTGERVWGEYGEVVWEDWVTLIGKRDLVPCIPDSLSEKTKDFLTKCLERDPSKRWSVDSLINHEFLEWIDEDEDYEEEEEEEEIYEEGEALYYEIEYADVEAYVAVEEEAIEIDEEYPKEEDSEEDS